MEQMNQDVKEVFAKTHALAHALLNSEIYREMRQAEAEAMSDAEAATAMGEYLEHKTALEELLSQDDPDAAKMSEHSSAMDEIQTRMQSIPSIARMTQARGEFSNLINQVNQIISFVITGGAPARVRKAAATAIAKAARAVAVSCTDDIMPRTRAAAACAGRPHEGAGRAI